MNNNLYEDQIHSGAWIKRCDYAFNESNEPWVSSKGIKMFSSPSEIGETGVVFCGTNQRIINCLKTIPENGSYILVTRDNDQSITQELFELKPTSVKHWFAINCAIKNENITAIPYGVNGIGGENETLKIVGETIKRTFDGRMVYARFNIPGEMKYPHERHECLFGLEENNPVANIIYKPVDGAENYINIMQHPFVASPHGTGAETMRCWEALSLGAIPILSDVPELRHFEDLPVCFVNSWKQVTEDWCKEQAKIVAGKLTHKVRMSFWQQNLQIQKEKYGIGH